VVDDEITAKKESPQKIRKTEVDSKIVEDAGESSFGQGEHQQETVYDAETPFFMR